MLGEAFPLVRRAKPQYIEPFVWYEEPIVIEPKKTWGRLPSRPLTKVAERIRLGWVYGSHQRVNKLRRKPMTERHISI